MKKSIHKVLRCGRWALVAAGGLGTCVAAWTQTSPGLLPPVKSAQSLSAGQVGVAQTAHDLHQAEMRVELAWMVDPLTFPYTLEARTVGTVLEIRGEVLTPSDHEQAVRLAQEESGMRVVDRLQVNPRLVLPRSTKPASLLQRQAIDSLGNDLPQRARDLSVSVWTNGQVLVKGSVPTYEDKLAVSRTLRRVGGCSCIINQLQVDDSNSGPGVARLGSPTQNQGIQPASALTAPSPTAGVSMLAPEALSNHSGIKPVSFQSEASPASGPARSQEPPTSIAVTTPKQTSKPIVAYQTKWRKLQPTEMPGGDGKGNQPAAPQEMRQAQPTAPESTPGTAPVLKPPVAAKPDKYSAIPQKPAPTSGSVFLAALAESPLNTKTATSQSPAGSAALPPRTVPSDWSTAPAAKLASNETSAPLPAYRSSSRPGDATPYEIAATEPLRSTNQPLPSFTQKPFAASADNASGNSTAARTDVIAVKGASDLTTYGGASADTSKSMNRPASLVVKNQQAPNPDDSKFDNKIVRSGTTAKGNDKTVPPVTPLPPPVPRTDAYVTTGVIIMDPEIRQSSAPSPTPAIKPAAAPKDMPRSPDSYVSTGIVLLEVPEAKPERRFTPGQIRLQTRLQQRIAAVCAKSTEDVQVTLSGEKDVQVKIKAASAREGESLSGKVFQMAELGPYEVALDITVMR